MSKTTISLLVCLAFGIQLISQTQTIRGNIIDQEKVRIGENETAGELHDRLMTVGAKLVLKTVRNIEKDTINTQPQNENQKLKEAFKIFKPFCKIDWGKPIDVIHNHIRGLSPYPTAYTELQNKTTNEIVSCKIFKTAMLKETHQHKVTTIITSKTELKIAVNGGFIAILELQLAGKKRMKTADFLKGYKA